MNLTVKQLNILAVCSLCQSPLEPEAVRPALQSGKLRPGQLMCEPCAADNERMLRVTAELAAFKAAELAAERTKRAGLFEHYERVCFEENMKTDNKQN